MKHFLSLCLNLVTDRGFIVKRHIEHRFKCGREATGIFYLDYIRIVNKPRSIFQRNWCDIFQ